MAVKLRLMRMGKKKHPTYRVVAADSRSPRDGRFIELIGRYDPHPDPSVVEIDNDRALHWLTVGAQPTAAVKKLLEISGAWGQFRVQRGDVHVVGTVAPPEARERKSKKARAKQAEEAAAPEVAAVEGAEPAAEAAEPPSEAPEAGAASEPEDAEPAGSGAEEAGPAPAEGPVETPAGDAEEEEGT